jgi:hypothetical protein
MIAVNAKHAFIGIKVRKLPCGHYFHKTCIENVLGHKAICPICRLHVYSSKESDLLKKFVFTQSDLEYIKSMTSERAMILLRDAVRVGQKELVEEICAIFDPTEVIHHYISKRNVDAILQLLYSKCLNWHRTFHGKTLLDAAIETKDPLIKNIISSGTALNYFVQSSCS